MDGSSDAEAATSAAGADDGPVSLAPDPDAILDDSSASNDSDADSDMEGGAQSPPQKRPQPRPRPVPRRKSAAASERASGDEIGVGDAAEDAEPTAVSSSGTPGTLGRDKGGAGEDGDGDSDDAVPVRRRVVRRAIIDDDDDADD